MCVIHLPEKCILSAMFIFLMKHAKREIGCLFNIKLKKKMETEVHLCIIIDDVLKICRAIVSSSSAKPHTITPFVPTNELNSLDFSTLQQCWEILSTPLYF